MSVIELFDCEPFRAKIPRKQCEANREQGRFLCHGCPGLGGLAETVAGGEPKPRPFVPTSYVERGRRGAASRKRTLLAAAITRDRILGGGLPVEVVDRPVIVSFDVVDEDDRALIRRIEQCAYDCGITLGDEILARLAVMEEFL